MYICNALHNFLKYIIIDKFDNFLAIYHSVFSSYTVVYMGD